ncbi:uncharacterized protein LOC144904090 [Branchiostoma floridae x Branchiostoma belcheri]
MATAKSTKQSNFSVEQESMFRRMIRKVRKGSSEDDLEVVGRTKPSQGGDTEHSLREAKECRGGLLGHLQDLQMRLQAQGAKYNKQETLILSEFARGLQAANTMIRQLEEIRERERTEAAINIKDLEAHLTDTRQQISQKDQEIQSLNDCVAVLEAEKKGERTKGQYKISELEKCLVHQAANIQRQISQKNLEIQSLNDCVAVLEAERKEEGTEAQYKISELGKRLVHQAANTQHQISQKDEEIQSLKDYVAVLETEKKRILQKDEEIQSLKARVAVLETERKGERTELQDKIEELENRLVHQAANTQHQISQKDEEIQSLKACVAVLETERKGERTEAQDKIKDLENRLVHQAANTQHQISQKDEEIQSLMARVAVLETEKKELNEARHSLIDPRPFIQELQKVKKINEERTEHQQKLIIKLQKQMEANKGFVKNLKEELTEQMEPHSEMLNNTPSPEDVNNVATIKRDQCEPKRLLIECTRSDTEQQRKADKNVPKQYEEAEKKREPDAPMLLLNGRPLDNDVQHDEAETKRETDTYRSCF